MERNFEYRKRMRQERLEARKRAALRRKVRFLAAVGTFVFILISVVSANAVIARAGQGMEKTYEKRYTGIEVERGETVWDIAQEYVVPGYTTVDDMIQEIRFINGLDEECSVQSGMFLMIPYYAES